MALKPAQVAQQAKEQLSALTGLKPETVSSLHKVDEGWSVTVDMIELKRIPESSDVLATYEVVVDDDGDLLTYKRTRRYQRSDTSITVD